MKGVVPMFEQRQLYIDGVWRDGSGDAFGTVIDPASEEPVASLAQASPIDVQAAIDAASRGGRQWGALSAATRSGVLAGAADRLLERIEDEATALTREQGKTLAESRAEFRRAVDTLRWHAEAIVERDAMPVADGRVRTMAEPIGIVAAFTPWNYPAVIAARKLAAALAAGCPVVLKGAEEAPGAAVAIVRALEDSGLPPGVVNLLFGDPSAISAQLLDAVPVRAFSFTGSTVVGKQLAARAANTLTRCVLELGGHSPVLVCADADLDAAVEAIAAYKFECAGQSCNAPSRIYVDQSVFAPFVDRFVARARALRVGDGLDSSTQMGPMAMERRLTAMQTLVDDVQRGGGEVLTGGARLDRRGYFWPPTVVTNVPATAALLREEPFGPLAPIVSFATFDEAIARANDNVYGLASYVFTQSRDLAARAARALDAGSVGVNALQGVPPDVGIAGVKDSGYGYEGGHRGIDAFVNVKVVRRA